MKNVKLSSQRSDASQQWQKAVGSNHQQLITKRISLRLSVSAATSTYSATLRALTPHKPSMVSPATTSNTSKPIL